MKLEIRIQWAFVLVFSIVLVSSISAVTYFSSKGVFDAQITYVNDQKLPHSIILNLDSKVEDSLEYDIEVIYKRENLVVGSKKIMCQRDCEAKIELKKSFFDTNQVIIRAEYDGKYYEQKLEFELEETKKNKVYIQAGAGIVADSDPKREFNETKDKASALIEALSIALDIK